MKKLICLALSAVFLMSICGCTGKQSEFTPVEGFEEASEVIYGIEFGMTHDEYEKSSAHKLMAQQSRTMQYTTQGIQGSYPDNYADWLYRNVGLDSWKSEASMANVEFVDDGVVSVNFCFNTVGGEESAVLEKQNNIIRVFGDMAEEMGFVKQESFGNIRYPATVYDGYYLLSAYDDMFYPLRLLWYEHEYEPYNPNETEYLESQNMYVKMKNDVIYYLSEDGSKALAIAPYDIHSKRESVYIPGDDPYWERDELYAGLDPETEFDKISGLTPDMKFAPVYVTYYDVATVRDNYRMFDGGSGYLCNPCMTELLKELDETGSEAFTEKYKVLFD